MLEPREYQTQVLIIGAGIVGSALALGLARQGWQVCLVDRTLPQRRVGHSGFDARTLAIAPSARQWLRSLCAWPSTGCDFGRMVVWDEQSTGAVAFDAAELAVDVAQSGGEEVAAIAPALGTIIEQSLLVGALWDAVQRAPNIAVLAPYEIERLRCSAQAHVDLRAIDGDAQLHVRAQLVVGADGGGSRVRTLSGTSVRRKDTGHQAIASVVELSRSHENTAWQVFLPSGPLALLPLPDRAASGVAPAEAGISRDESVNALIRPPHGTEQSKHYASLVWSVTADRAEALGAQSAAEFCASVTQATQGRVGEIVACDARASFPIVQQQAERYVANTRTVLLGDAAHVLHPMAGQGVNLGLRHAELLLTELGRLPRNSSKPAADGAGPDLGDALLLQRYERKARARAAAMIFGMTTLQEVFERQDITLRWLRSVGMQTTDAATWLKQQLARSAMGQGL